MFTRDANGKLDWKQSEKYEVENFGVPKRYDLSDSDLEDSD